MVLLDTTVLIDVLRGHSAAIQYLSDLKAPVGISVITVAELYVGVRPGEETALSELIGVLDTLSVDADIARVGGIWRQQYTQSHGVSLPDALIAATAVRYKAQLATHNIRHFPMLPNAFVPY